MRNLAYLPVDLHDINKFYLQSSNAILEILFMKNWTNQFKIRQLLLVKSLSLIALVILPFAVIAFSAEIHANIISLNANPIMILLLLFVYITAFAVVLYKYFYISDDRLIEVNKGLQNIINGKNFEGDFKNSFHELDTIAISMHKIQATMASLIENQQNNILARLGVASSAQTNDSNDFMRMQLQSITAGSMQNAVEHAQSLTNELDELQPIYQKSLIKIDELADSIQENKFLTRLIFNAVFQNSNSINSTLVETAKFHETALQTVSAIEELDFKLSNFIKGCEQINNLILATQEVVSHINLLALNAAIESSRADELSKGFGVVALEMKKLADETNKIADEISDQVKTIQDSALDSVASVKNIFTVVNNLQLLALNVHKTVNQQKDLSANTEDAANQMHQLSEAIEQNMLSVTATFQKMHDLFKNIGVSGQNVYGNNQLILTELKSLSNFII